MKRFVAFTLVLLFLFQVFSGIYWVYEYNARTENIESISRRGVDNPGTSKEIRAADTENDDFGGSWFDDLDDENGIQEKDNIDITGGPAELSYSGPIGYWKFDESNGIIARDDSIYANHGVINGSENWTDGKSGGALEFDGVDDIVEVESADEFNVTEICVEAWIQIADFENEFHIINRWNTKYPWQLLVTNNSDENPRVIRFAWNAGGGGNNLWGETELSLNTWYHIAATYDGSKFKIYLNGVLVNETASSVALVKDVIPIQIGGRTYRNIYSKGVIDEVRLYNRALELSEIRLHENVTESSTYGSVTSKAISLPYNMKWDMLALNKDEPFDTDIRVTVIDTSDDGVIPGYFNLTPSNIDLAHLNDIDVDSIRLKAFFSGNEMATPALNSWGVEWVKENTWRDSFTGDGKSSSHSIVDENTVAYWNFDDGSAKDMVGDNDGTHYGNTRLLMHFDEGEGQDVADESDYDNNGQLGSSNGVDDNDPMWTSGGINGDALIFDGKDDYIDCGNNPSLDITDEISMEAWIFPRSWGPYGNYGFGRITNKGSLGMYLHDTASPGGPDHSLFVSMKIGNQFEFLASAKDTIKLNTWQHVAFSYNGSDLNIYIDGVQCPFVGGQPSGKLDSEIDSNLQIGNSENLDRAFNGTIDEVGVYSRVLTYSEIQSRYTSGRAQLCDVTEGPRGQGKALQFDGVDDYVDCGSRDDLDNINEITIEAWIKMNSRNALSRILDKADIDLHFAYGYRLLFTDNGKYIKFQVGTGVEGEAEIVRSTSIIPLGIWTHITAIATNTKIEIYVNGIKEHGEDIVNSELANTNSLFVGKYQGNNKFFNGLIDEVRISNIARSLEEIHRSYRAGISFYGGVARLGDNEVLPNVDCVGLWHFDEGEGNMSLDSSGNRIDGTIHGGENWTNGVRGGALEFDGVDDYVNYGAHPPLQITGDLTLECWAKYVALSEENSLILQGKGNTDGSSHTNILYYFYITPAKKLSILWEYGSGSNEARQSTEAANINSGEWYHFTVVRDTNDKKVSFYVNGIQLGDSVSYSNGPFDGSSTPLEIGGTWDYHENDAVRAAFYGAIDEVAIHDRILTLSEIQDHCRDHYNNSIHHSETITLPEDQTWDKFHFNRDVSQNTYLNISILDAGTGNILYQEYNNTSEGTIDLSILGPKSHPNLYFKAYLQSSTTQTPTLFDWSVNWTKIPEPEIVHPELSENVASEILITEDTPEENITDLVIYFNDIYSDTTPSTYGIQYISDEENVTLKLNGSKLDVTYLAENWTGTVQVIANCTNMHDLSTPTNMFNITVTGVNDAPVSQLVSPINGGVVPSTEVTLEWKAVDVDNAPGDLVFDLYFGNNSTPPLKKENITGTTTALTDLVDGETYYWCIIPNDGILTGQYQNGTWNFTVDLDVSVPEVDLHSPTDQSIINTTYTNLTWSVFNETEGIIYSIYFGLEKENLQEIDITVKKWYQVTELAFNRTYYWKILPVAGAIQGRCISGTWKFSVQKDFIPIYNITAELIVTEINIEQGQSAIFNITLTNNGNIPTRVEFAPSGIISGVLEMKGSVLIPIGDTIIVTGTITDSSSLTVKKYQLPIVISYSNETLTLSLTINITPKDVPSDDDDIEDDEDNDGTGDDSDDKGGILGLDLWIWIVIVVAVILLFIVRYLIVKHRDTDDWDEEEEDEDEGEEDDEDEETGGPSIGPVLESSETEIFDEEEDVEVWGTPEEEPEVWGAEEAPPDESEVISPTIKTIIPGYTLVSKLGTGGFATVYKAIGPEGKEYAIKLPKFMDSTVDTSVLTKFKEESDIWKKLKHRGVVTFYKGDIRPVPYMVIEYMEGGNLLEKMKKGKMPVNEAISLIMEILSGMSYAHRMASVHRDIKPENILFTKDGRPKISDWGIGKFMASESVSKTVGGKGTLAYSSPEQISPENFGEIDWSTDVFQLGIVFYEMLTGENPFMRDDPVTIMSRLVSHIPAPPSAIRPEIPAEMDSIILRALEKDKVRRFSSADSMFEKLKEAMKDRLENIEHYKDMLKAALADGVISTDEEVMLQGFKKRFKISEEDDLEMRKELMS